MSRGWLFSISVSALFLMSTADKQPALGQEFLACDNVTSRVDLEVIPINNDSHCSGYVGAYLTNRTNYRIICVVGFQREKDGSWNKSMISVRPQQKKEATLAAYRVDAASIEAGAVAWQYEEATRTRLASATWR